MVAPAIGPFIYEQGVDQEITFAQNYMLEFYSRSVNEGPEFLKTNGGSNFTAGLAAMPSLHVASSILFTMYSWVYGRLLFPLYIIAVLFISVTAIASRWHYLVDIPFGILLAYISYKISKKLGT